jgi:hypothetical protein
METVLLTLLIVALAVVGLSLRILLVKGGEFRGTCASNNPMLKDKVGNCAVCGSKPGEACQNDEDGGGRSREDRALPPLPAIGNA